MKESTREEVQDLALDLVLPEFVSTALAAREMQQVAKERRGTSTGAAVGAIAGSLAGSAVATALVFPPAIPLIAIGAIFGYILGKEPRP